MSGEKIAFCADQLTCQNPDLVGLAGEVLESQDWLSVFVAGEEARSAIKEQDCFSEAWVVSCDDVDPINLAATLKADCPNLSVCLVSMDRCGSLYSRAHTASIDEVLDPGSFLERYNRAKAHFANLQNAVGTGDASYSDQQGETISVAVKHEVAQPELQIVPTKSLPYRVIDRQEVGVAVRNRGFVMPVVSGSGGAGKSSVSVLAAFVARDMGYRTLLLDYDLQFGDVSLMAGVENPLTIDEAIAHPNRLEREISLDTRLTVIAAPDRLEKAEGVVAEMPAFLDRVAPAYDVIVANTGAAWAEQHAVLLERSYTALFLIDQRASSLRACKHALELCARCGIATGPFEFALNRCMKGAPLTVADASCALQGSTVFELRDGGRDVEDYLASGAVDDLLQTGNEFCVSVRQVMERLLPKAGSTTSSDATRSGDNSLAKRRGRHAGRKRGRRP